MTQPHITEQESDNLVRLGKRIRHLRKMKGVTQKQLGRALQLDSSHISRIENGLLNTGVANIFRIAACLGVNPKDLFEFPG